MKNAQINKQEYVLKNKDKNILEFSILKYLEDERLKNSFTYSLGNIKIIDKNLLPIAMTKEKGSDLEALDKWIKHRKIPKGRAFANELLKAIGEDENPYKYIDISFALSLNDSYWIVPKDRNYTWSNYNLYRNPFDKILSLVAFGLAEEHTDKISSSPELTTNGMLPKCWHINKKTNKIELLKGSNIFQNLEETNNIDNLEVFSEYYMSQIASCMGLEHVNYNIKLHHGKLACSCEIFTSEKYGYLPITYCLKTKIKLNNKLSSIQEIQELYGKEAFEDLMLFDSIIANTDRHAGNFGMIIDNDTNKLVKPAPIFDNGLSLFHEFSKEELENKDFEYFPNWFGISKQDLLEVFFFKRQEKMLENLLNFTFTRHEKYNLPEGLLKAGEKFIQNRAKKILKIIQEKKN